MDTDKRITALEEQLNQIHFEILKVKELQKSILVGMGADRESLKEV